MHLYLWLTSLAYLVYGVLEIVFTCVSYTSAAQQLKACPCLSYPNSVRPSVCLSHAGIVSKRLNVLS